MIKKTIKLITEYPLCFLAGAFVLAVFVGFIPKRERVFSEMENRYLAAKPVVSLSGLADGSYMEEFESFTEEQLPLRNAFIRMKSLTEELLLKCENNGIIRGKDGYLFEKNFSLSSQLYKNISTIENFAKVADRDIYLAVAPNSSWIFEEKLPLGAPVLDENLAEDELENRLAKYDNIHIVDLYEALNRQKSVEDELYYRTDHHWTTKGAYVAYKVLADRMGFAAVELDELTAQKVDDFYGTYYSKYKGIGITADSITYYDVPIDKYICDKNEYDNLLDFSKLSEYDKYAMFMYGNPGFGEIISGIEDDISGSGYGTKPEIGADKKKKLIVFKDSYANSVLPFLACSYEDIIIMDLRYYKDSVADVLAANPDADILLMYNWSFVNEDNHFYKLVK